MLNISLSSKKYIKTDLTHIRTFVLFLFIFVYLFIYFFIIIFIIIFFFGGSMNPLVHYVILIRLGFNVNIPTKLL